jgi:sulfoxide reductase catalytic subunit YedY
MTAIRIDPGWTLDERLATPESTYLNRRQVVAGLGLGTLSLALSPGCSEAAREATADRSRLAEPALGERFADVFPAPRNAAFDVGQCPVTAEETAASYNNFYEFTTAKERVWELAQGYEVDPWQVRVHGLVKRERTLDLDDLFKRFELEERLYRFRCVERWAMQVPWSGFPLAKLIDYLEPLSSARYVRFVTILDKKGLPGISAYPWYTWPYFEGLRMDEARHELAFVALGSYGHALPMQHGAPWRLAIPWKYGYKGPKSLVEIEFVETEPATFWNEAAPREYGFYSNVNPDRPHPRWSQAEERDIGTGESRPTLLFNGYAEQVGSLYTGREF